jgi:Threonine dehydrogenase and related Zn-dependent dehydrogenases
MKALRYHGPKELRYEDVPDVSPRSGEVKLRIRAVGICGSDVHGYLGITGRRIPPMTMGHEFSGEIVELGEGVDGLTVGDRVACFPFGFDGTCDTCRRGDFTLCENRILYGVLTDDGAFADYLCVTQGTCIKLADSVSFEAGSLIEPLTVAYHATGRIPADMIRGKNVLLVGAGTIGLMTLLCLKKRGAAQILVSDLGDSRLELAKRMGATHVFNPSRDDVPAKAFELTGGMGVDAAFEAVGATPTVQAAMSSLRRGGMAVWIGNSQKIIEVNMQEVVTRELTITGTNAFSLETFKEAARMINDGEVDVSPIISRVAPMAEGVELFRTLAENPGDLIKVVLGNA